MNNFNSSRFNRNRSLLVSEFKPQSWEEQSIYEIAKIIGEKEVRFLLSIKERYGYKVIEDAWNEMRKAMLEKRPIKSRARFLNHLIQERIRENN